MNPVTAPELSFCALLILKVAAIVSLSLLACVALRRAAASVRYGVLLCAFAAVAALPLSALLPREASLTLVSPLPLPLPPQKGRGKPIIMREIPVGQGFHPLPMSHDRQSCVRQAPLSPSEGGGAGGGGLPTSTTPLHVPVTTIFLAFYLMGLSAVLLRFALALFRLRRLSARAVAFDTPEIVVACRRMGLHNTMTVRCSAEVAAPLMFGWRRPTILLPADAPQWPAERRDAALLHETAHIARRDWPALAFAQTVCALYWFHPLVWLAAARLRAEAERAADDRVLLAGFPAPAYARHLLEIARTLHFRSAPKGAALAMTTTPHLERRLRALLDTAVARRPAPTPLALAALLVLMTLFLLIPVHLRAQEPAGKQPPRPTGDQLLEERRKAWDVEIVSLEKQLEEAKAERQTFLDRMTTDRDNLRREQIARWERARKADAAMRQQIQEMRWVAQLERLAPGQRKLLNRLRQLQGERLYAGLQVNRLDEKLRSGAPNVEELSKQRNWFTQRYRDLGKQMEVLRERVHKSLPKL